MEARMIAPESITVPSRSNRTTGNRMRLMLARQRADPDRPRPDALDRQDRAHPRIVGEPLTDLALALGAADEQRRPVVGITKRSSQKDHALCDQSVHVSGVLVPAVLLPPPSRRIPRRPGKLSDQKVRRSHSGSGLAFVHLPVCKT